MSPGTRIQDTPSAHRRDVRLIVAAVALAWLGLYLHNAAEFPQLPPTSPETSIPTLVWWGLFLLWWALPGRRWPTRLLFGWGALCLAGAVVTVLPLPILPFRPEQSLRHYGVHVIDAVMQFPLLRLTWRMLRPPSDPMS
jgi:hypothetical protein